MRTRRLFFSSGPISWLLAATWLVACAKSPPAAPEGAGGSGGAGGGAPVPGQITISVATPRPRSATVATVGVNYWSWVPAFGNTVAGTEADVTALAPRYLRIGGHNNDNNNPAPFSAAEIDRAVAYSRAVGAEPILQVPLLADESGLPPTATTAAAMVTYANVTKSYGIRYFEIGNEPDLYPDQEVTLPGYTPANYCASARAFAAAMKAADPTIQLVGPDLSWKYQPGTSGNDWMTPILSGCGDVFDVISFHRYPFAPTAATAASAQGDAVTLTTVIASVRAIMQATGQAAKPLALTETNITYDGSPEKSVLDASPGTVPAGLWAADTLGTGLGAGLWTTAMWSISEGWTLGLITPEPRVQRPAYHAVRVFAEHFGPNLVAVTATPPGVRLRQPRRRRHEDPDGGGELEPGAAGLDLRAHGDARHRRGHHPHRRGANLHGGGDPGQRQRPGLDLRRARMGGPHRTQPDHPGRRPTLSRRGAAARRGHPDRLA